MHRRTDVLLQVKFKILLHERTMDDSPALQDSGKFPCINGQWKILLLEETVENNPA
jgi:hypothetical protein